MPAGRDDDALLWDGDDDPTLDVGAAVPADPAPERAPLPAGFTAVGKGADTPSTPGAKPAADPAPADAPLGSAALISMGVIGGIFLLYSIGWIIGGLRVTSVSGFLVSPTGAAPVTWTGGNLVGVWLAAAAPAIWFVTVVVLTRASRAWVRWVWLAAGVVLLVPWPLLMSGGVA